MINKDLSPIMTKPCIKCGAIDRSSRGRCKPCINSRSAAWNATNPEKKRATGIAYRLENSEKYKAAKAARYANNREQVNAAHAVYRAKNKDKAKLASAAWYSANRKRVKTLSDAWRAANPEARRTYKQNRRSRKVENGGILSSGLSLKLFALQRGKCACCKQPLGEKYDLDHIMPLALGGPNTDDNIQLLRRECNRKKSAKHPVQYMQEKGFLL